MNRFSNFIAKQSNLLLENKQYAIFFAIIFAVLPLAAWLSVALVALVTLRKGARSGFDVLLPALVVHSAPLMMFVPFKSAMLNTLVAYLPCYIAAIALRKTMNWQIVCGILFMLAFIAASLFQYLMPNFITDQFHLFNTLLSQYKDYQEARLSHSDVFNSVIWAQLFFGMQILMVVITSIVSLAFARSIQARLFILGGFWKEWLAFRSGKVALVFFVGISVGSYYEIPLALNLLPLMICYFLMSGFGLAYFILAGKKQATVAILLVLLIFISPTFVLFAYIIVGTLDSLFNFRLYLPAKVREST